MHVAVIMQNDVPVAVVPDTLGAVQAAIAAVKRRAPADTVWEPDRDDRATGTSRSAGYTIYVWTRRFQVGAV